MKPSLRACVCLCVLVSCTLVRTMERESRTVNNEQMHKVVKSMLGFREAPKMPHPLNGAEDAPKYMLDLYDRFKDGPISKGQLNGNTVRSIKGKPELVNGRSMFVFNLSSLVSAEQIISAEIHLYKRRKTRYNKEADLELVMHEITPNYTIRSGQISVNIATFGWQWYDVTPVVKSCVSERRLRPHLFGLNFELKKSNGNSNVLKLSRFMHHHSSPYLVIYSNDSQTFNLDELDKISERLINSEKNIAPVDESSNADTVKADQNGRTKRSLSDNSADIPLYQSRARSMSILTNEIPENPDDYRPYPINMNLKTHPGMLQTRKESRHKIADSRLIPYPGDYVDKRKRKKWRNRQKSKSSSRKNRLELPREWDDLQSLAEEKHPKNLCGKKKLVVDFNDIGWGEWIISPKSFKAHYCAGACPFPLTKKLRPSNHATIQSLVNAVGLNADVPAPCCVPDKLSSITLLYFDEDRNVVLKNYPNMTVQKCACR